MGEGGIGSTGSRNAGENPEGIFFPLVCNPMDVYFCSFGVVFSYFPSKATIIVAIIVVDFFSL